MKKMTKVEQNNEKCKERKGGRFVTNRPVNRKIDIGQFSTNQIYLSLQCSHCSL